MKNNIKNDAKLNWMPIQVAYKVVEQYFRNSEYLVGYGLTEETNMGHLIIRNHDTVLFECCLYAEDPTDIFNDVVIVDVLRPKLLDNSFTFDNVSLLPGFIHVLIKQKF
jgi:hypothetical protein